MSDSLCRRRKGNRLGDLYVVALATVSRGLAGHSMLTMALAAVLRHLGVASTLLNTGEAGPGQKKGEGQDRYPHYPEAMSLVPLHDAMQTLLSNLRVHVNPCCLFFGRAGG